MQISIVCIGVLFRGDPGAGLAARIEVRQLPVTGILSPMARTAKYYHHGRSPAAWAGSVMAAVGFIAAAVGSMLGPNWPVLILGAALIVIAGLTTMVMKAMGLGQP